MNIRDLLIIDVAGRDLVLPNQQCGPINTQRYVGATGIWYLKPEWLAVQETAEGHHPNWVIINNTPAAIQLPLPKCGIQNVCGEIFISVGDQVYVIRRPNENIDPPRVPGF